MAATPHGAKPGLNTPKNKAPGLQSEGSQKNTTTENDSTGANPAQLELNLHPTKLKYSRKSTSTEAQYERIDRMLSTGEKNTFQFRKAGIMSPASRIKEMNDRLGYYIPTIDQRDIYDEEGYLHKRVGVYKMIDRAMKAAQ